MTIACVGTGNVGRSWAIVFARAGHDTVLWDANAGAMERAGDLIAATLADLHSAGAVGDVDAIKSRIRFAGNLREAVAGAVHVQESVSEQLEVKRALFGELDRLAPAEAVLASSTSAIPASLFMTDIPGSARCLVVHPVNPPHLIPLVELSPTALTAPQTVDRTAALMTEVGQRPIRLRREIEGFALNRLQWALMAEAMHLVGEGYCSAEDIDRVMTDGLALRWALMGPLSVAHLNADAGLRGYFGGLSEAIERVQSSLRTDYRPSRQTIDACHDALAAHLPVEDLAAHQARRDRNILALRRFLQRAE